MNDETSPIPDDDLSRALRVARPDRDETLIHVGLVGDTYTILVSGEDTAGAYTLIDMHVPHAFRNVGDQPARLLCLCSPAGQDEFFLEVGQRVGTRTEPPEPLDEASEQEFRAKAGALAPRYRTQLLPPLRASK